MGEAIYCIAIQYFFDGCDSNTTEQQPFELLWNTSSPGQYWDVNDPSKKLHQNYIKMKELVIKRSWALLLTLFEKTIDHSLKLTKPEKVILCS